MESNEDRKDDKAVDILVRFGISREEAGLFVFLSRANRRGISWLRGSQISAISKKGRVRTYQILQKLLELGLVRTDFSRPKKYSAVSPQVSIRRLLAVHETRLTELSHLEKEAIESLLRLSPLGAEISQETEESGTGTIVSLLQGIANIQAALRELMEGSDLLVVTNKESIEHILLAIKYLADKPKSVKLVFASDTRPPLREYNQIMKENHISVRWLKEDSPPYIVAKDKVAFLYYSTKKGKPRPLSPVATTTNVSQIALADSANYAREMVGNFELIWRNTEKIGRVES